MKRALFSLALLAACTASAFAADPSVTLPKMLTVKPGRLLKIEAQSDQKVIKWVNLNPDADLIASESGKWAIFSAPASGSFSVGAYTAAGDVPSDLAVCVVTVGSPVPPPPPIPPTDPLLLSLQAAYATEAATDRAASVKALAAFYRAAVATANDQKLATYADLLAVLVAAETSYLPATAIPGVRKAVNSDLKLTFGADTTKAIDRVAAAKEFGKAAATLDLIATQGGR